MQALELAKPSVEVAEDSLFDLLWQMPVGVLLIAIYTAKIAGLGQLDCDRQRGAVGARVFVPLLDKFDLVEIIRHQKLALE